jgi:hypothetical protein
MLSDYERYQRLKESPLDTGYDEALVHELLTVISRYTEYWEDRYMGAALFVLLRLIRANPDLLFEDHNAFFAHRGAEEGSRHPTVRWTPNAISGMKLKLSKRHPLYRLLSHHFPVGHRVWRYIDCGPAPRTT